MPFELGLYTFADIAPDPATGAIISPRQRLRNLIEEIELADQLGLDVFGVGEHHRSGLCRLGTGRDPRRSGGADANGSS